MSRKLKIEDQTNEDVREAKASDRPLGGGVVPEPGVNETKTDIGDPMALQYNKGDLHNAPSHITGSGHGAPFRVSRRMVDIRNPITQTYAKMAASGKEIPQRRIPVTKYAKMRRVRDLAPMVKRAEVTTTVADPPKPILSPSIFDEKGRAKSVYDHNPRDFDLPVTESEQTYPYRVGNEGLPLLLNNPLTRMADQGPGYGALAGALGFGVPALLGAGAYHAYKGLTGGKKEDRLPAWRWAALASLLGAGLGAYSGHLRQKGSPHSPQNKAYLDSVSGEVGPPLPREMWRKGASIKEASTIGELQGMIQSLRGSGLPHTLVERIVNIMVGLHPSDARALRIAAGGLGGLALGVFLAKRFGLGSLLTAGLGLAGGFTGLRMMGGPMPRRGRTTDIYGNPYN